MSKLMKKPQKFKSEYTKTLQPLDFVRTEGGSIGLVTETNDLGMKASVTWIGKSDERTAWWDCRELEVIDSLPHLMAKGMAHPFGNGRTDADTFFKR